MLLPQGNGARAGGPGRAAWGSGQMPVVGHLTAEGPPASGFHGAGWANVFRTISNLFAAKDRARTSSFCLLFLCHRFLLMAGERRPQSKGGSPRGAGSVPATGELRGRQARELRGGCGGPRPSVS